jgi:hypothetical protein
MIKHDEVLFQLQTSGPKAPPPAAVKTAR